MKAPALAVGAWRFAGERTRTRAIAVGLVLVVVTLYARALGFGFVNYDDPLYVTENRWVTGGLTGEAVRWAFAIHGPSMWVPLTWLSHQAVCTLVGLQPALHHGLNILLHAGNAVLAFLAFQGLTGVCWRPALVGLLLAVHPLHVESVAWVTERKDVLALAGVLAALYWYGDYARAPSRAGWCKVTGALLLALLAKPLAVTLPCVLLLLDYWPLRRFAWIKADAGGTPAWRTTVRMAWPCVREKLPWLAAALVASWLTVLCQQSIQAIGSWNMFPPGMRLLNAVSSYGAYLTKAVWPTKLAAFYPYPSEISWLAVAWGGILLGAGTWRAIRHAVDFPWALVGWLWFLGTFVPMIGLIQAGGAARADRYAYLPHLGLYVIVAWGLGAWVVHRPTWRPAILAGLFILVGVWGTLAWRQVGVWRDSETLFLHVLDATGPNHLAYNNLGIAAREQRRNARAEELFRQAVTAKPEYSQGWNNLGIEQAEKGSMLESRQSFARAIEYDPNNAHAWLNLGRTWLTTGDPARAEEYFRRALALNDEIPMAHFQLGLTRRAAGDLRGAAEALRRAVALQPSQEIRQTQDAVLAELAGTGNAVTPRASPDTHGSEPAVSSWRAANAAAAAGDTTAQQSNLEAALVAQPDFRPALMDLGQFWRERGNPTKSAEYLLAALRVQSTPEVHNELGVLYREIGDQATAARAFREALRLRPNWDVAAENLRRAEAALAGRKAK